MRRAVLLASTILVVSGCSRRANDPVQLAVDPPLASVTLGKTVRFTNAGVATGTTWSVAAPAGHGIISTDGVYQAPFFLPTTPSATIELRAGDRIARGEVRIFDGPRDDRDCVGDSAPDTGFVYVEELPEAIVRVAPSYPDAARLAGVQGTVLVRARICKGGLIDTTDVIQSIPLLDDAAVTAIRRWVFRPARTHGQPIAVWVMIPVRFVLREPHAIVGAPELRVIALE